MDQQDSSSKADASSGTGVSRRTFIQSSAAVAALTVVPGWLGTSAYAQGEAELKLALVGCGGRGKGAMNNALEAATRLGLQGKAVAVCDYFEARASEAGEVFGVPPEQRFAGTQGYHKVMQSDADIVILATPPLFRPVHLDAAVEAGKHVFIEKPVAVDPPGCRRIMAAGERARTKGLNIVAGTQRRHQLSYLRHAHAIQEGAVGKILSGQIHWCQGRLWYKPREAGESDADYMVRNWVNFNEMSGDHITEQHCASDRPRQLVHRPAPGIGGRFREPTAADHGQSIRPVQRQL